MNCMKRPELQNIAGARKNIRSLGSDLGNSVLMKNGIEGSLRGCGPVCRLI